MDSGTWAAGILGAIGGAAQGGMVVAKYEMDEEAERRRLYSQELKERRMAEFGLQIKRDASRQDVIDMTGGTEEASSAFFAKYPGLAPLAGQPEQLAQVVSSDYTSTREAQEQVERDKVELGIKQAAEARAVQMQTEQENRAAERKSKEPTSFNPGAWVSTDEAMRKKLADSPEGIVQVPITYSASAQTRAIKDAIDQGKNSLTGGANPFSTTHEKLLQESSLSDVQGSADAASAYQAMLTDMAVTRVAARLNARAEADPQFGQDLSGGAAAAEMKAEQALIDSVIKASSDRYNTAIAAVPGLTPRQIETQANRILDTGEGVTDPAGKITNPRVKMEAGGLWTPTIRSLIKETMMNHYRMIQSGATPTSQAQPIIPWKPVAQR